MNLNVEGCCRGSWQWVDAGDIGDREIGGAQPALVSSQGRGKPSLGSRPGALLSVSPLSLDPGPGPSGVTRAGARLKRPGSLPCMGDRQCPGS